MRVQRKAGSFLLARATKHGYLHRRFGFNAN